MLGRARHPDWQAQFGEGQPKRCILWGCLSEGHMRVEEREGQGSGFLFIFKLFNLRDWRWDNSLLQNEACVLITACLLPVVAPEKNTKQRSVGFLKGEKHAQKNAALLCRLVVLLETRLAVLSSLPLLANPSIKYLRQPLPA